MGAALVVGVVALALVVVGGPAAWLLARRALRRWFDRRPLTDRRPP